MSVLSDPGSYFTSLLGEGGLGIMWLRSLELRILSASWQQSLARMQLWNADVSAFRPCSVVPISMGERWLLKSHDFQGLNLVLSYPCLGYVSVALGYVFKIFPNDHLHQ
jgi:hypothetical protein